MLTNFVTDTDLQSYYPKLANYLWKDATSYATQIGEAFNLVLDDLHNRGIDSRKLHIPIDLNRAADSTATQNTLTSLTKTATYTSTHVNGLTGFRRFVFDVTAIVTTDCTYSVVIQGSNDASITDTTEPTNWTTIKTITPDAAEVNSVICDEEYKYYRILLTVTGATASITFKASLMETYVDRWIIWKSLQIIFEDFIREDNDVWTRRAQNAKQRYDAAIENAQYRVDTDDDNLPEDGDESSNAAIVFMR